jgi:hypothetical protein
MLSPLTTIEEAAPGDEIAPCHTCTFEATANMDRASRTPIENVQSSF